MSLISITELEFVNGKKLNWNSLLLRAGVQQMKNKGMMKIEGHEKIIDLAELIIEISNVAKLEDSRNGNVNAKGKNNDRPN